MVKIKRREVDCIESYGLLTVEYNPNLAADIEIINSIENILKQQPSCSNCTNYQSDGCFYGYESYSCKIHGNIEAWCHPHHDMDGSKCREYNRINGIESRASWERVY